MSRKQRKNKERSRRHRLPVESANRQLGGVDYGCLPDAMAVGSLRFPEYMHLADVVGVAYGESYSVPLARLIPTITLLTRNTKPIRQAFDEFNLWSVDTDDDALELSFVFRRDGSYLLALSPERSRLERRCLGYRRTGRAILMLLTWVKPIETTSSALLSLRDYASSFPSPIHFDAGRISPNLTPSVRIRPDIEQIEGLRPLLKFEVAFFDETEVPPNSSAWVALQMASSRSRSGPRPGPPAPQPSDTGGTRARMLRTHFPVTIERLRRVEWFDSLCSGMARDFGVRRWQVDQAACNLLLSAELTGQPHFAGLRGARLQEQVSKALDARFELADGNVLEPLETEPVSRQILADAAFLLRHYRKAHQIQDVVAAQAALSSAGLLEAPSVTLLTQE